MGALYVSMYVYQPFGGPRSTYPFRQKGVSSTIHPHTQTPSPIPPTKIKIPYILPHTATGRVYPHTFLHRFDAASEELCLENEPRDLFTEPNFRKFSQMYVRAMGVCLYVCVESRDGWDGSRRQPAHLSNTYLHTYAHHNHSAWEEKAPTAFFRGTATGGGTTIETNQRLKIAHLSHVWCVPRCAPACMWCLRVWWLVVSAFTNKYTLPIPRAHTYNKHRAADPYYNGEENELKAPYLDAALVRIVVYILSPLLSLFKPKPPIDREKQQLSTIQTT